MRSITSFRGSSHPNISIRLSSQFRALSALVTFLPGPNIHLNQDAGSRRGRYGTSDTIRVDSRVFPERRSFTGIAEAIEGAIAHWQCPQIK